MKVLSTVSTFFLLSFFIFFIETFGQLQRCWEYEDSCEDSLGKEYCDFYSPIKG